MRQSADRGRLHRQYYEANYHEQGKVVAQTLSLAARYYKHVMEQRRAAADLGHDRCLHRLAM
jgi:TPR repeat protein